MLHESLGFGRVWSMTVRICACAVVDSNQLLGSEPMDLVAGSMRESALDVLSRAALMLERTSSAATAAAVPDQRQGNVDRPFIRVQTPGYVPQKRFFGYTHPPKKNHPRKTHTSTLT